MLRSWGQTIKKIEKIFFLIEFRDYQGTQVFRGKKKQTNSDVCYDGESSRIYENMNNDSLHVLTIYNMPGTDSFILLRCFSFN